jgi:zinc protease
MKTSKAESLINYEISNFTFPEVKSINLSKNQKLFIYNDNSQSLVFIDIIFHGGAYFDNIPGLSHFSAQLLKRGTKKRKSLQIAEETDKLGIKLSFSAERDYIKAGIICLRDFIDKAVDILSDCIFNSVFHNDEIKRYKLQNIAEIDQELADPSYISGLALNQSMFKKHPYSNPLIGNVDSIKSISQNDCIRWHNQLLNSPKIHIIASGNINNKKIINLISKYFKFKFSGSQPKLITKNKLRKVNKLVICEKEDINQVVLRFGRIIIDLHHKEYPAMKFLNTLFGGFFMSKLNILLREKLGYTYGIYSYLNTLKCTSVQVISTSVNKNSTKDSVNKISSEIIKLGSKKLTQKEFFITRQFLLGSFLRSTETSLQIAKLLRNLVINDLPLNYYNEFYKKIKSLTIDELFESQKKYYKPEGFTLSAVGDPIYISNKLNDFGLKEYFKPQ